MKKKHHTLPLIGTLFIVLLAGILSLSRAGFFSPRGALTGPGYYEGNFHTHTVASDGTMSYDEVIEEARGIGLDFIAITDHNTLSLATLALCREDKRILCLPGEEVTTTEGHMLAIGIAVPVPKDLRPDDAIALIRGQGGLAIAAHPGGSPGMPKGVVDSLPLDAVECNYRYDSSESRCSQYTLFPKVYDSDAHDLEDLGTLYNRCFLANLSLEAIRESVRAGNCTRIQG